MLLKIIASILDVDLGELTQRDADVRAARSRKIALASIAVGLILLTALVFTFLSWRRETIARHQAERQTRIVTAERLSSESAAELDSHPQRSLLLSREALAATAPDHSYEPEAESSLRQASFRINGQSLLGSDDRFAASSVADNGQWAVAATENSILYWNLAMPEKGDAERIPSNIVTGVHVLRIDNQGRWLLTIDQAGRGKLIDLRESPMSSVLDLNCRSTRGGDVRFSPDGRWLVTVSEGTNAPTAELHNLGDARDFGAVNLLGKERPPATSSNRFLPIFEFSPKGDWLFLRWENGTGHLWRLSKTPEPVGEMVEISEHDGAFTSFAFSKDDTKLLLGSNKGVLRAINLGPGIFSTEIYYTLDVPIQDVTADQPNPARRAVAITSVAYSEKGDRCAAGAANGMILTLPLAAWLRDQVYVLRRSEISIVGLQFSPNGRWLVSLNGIVPSYVSRECFCAN
jgi:WD40 repeat protein